MAKKKDNKPKFDPDEQPDFEDFDPSEFMDFGHLYDDFEPSSFWQEPDFLLTDIVHLMVNIAGLEIGVTLFIKGMTVSGQLTSEANYLKDLSDTFRQRVHVNKKRMSKKEKEEFEAMFDFTHMAESAISGELDKEDVMLPQGIPPIRYLHIKNPILVGTQGVMNFAQGPTPYLRLRLTMIDGWMLGEIVTPDMFMDEDDEEVLH